MTKISGNIVKINDTQFSFTPSSDLDPNTKYKMVVKGNFRSNDGILLNEDFNSYFTTTIKTINIAYPNENLFVNSNIDITWTSVNLDGETVSVEFYDGTSWNIIGSLIAVETGLLNWNVPVTVGQNRQIKIISSGGIEDITTFGIYADVLTIEGVEPGDNENNISINKNVVITFNNDIDLGVDENDIYIECEIENYTFDDEC
jgi:hypothetical protein